MRLQPSQKPTRSGRAGKYRFRIVVFVLVVALGSGLSSTGANPQTFVTLANFNGTDGQNPDPKTLVLAPDGNFYGTAQSGGANGSGTFFRITPAGDLISLYDFCSLPDCEDGGGPVAGLLLGSDGNLYGLASFGGANGVGTAFRFTTLGSFTLLNSLSPATGSFPFARLAEGPDGNFYGTASSGGNLAACGGFGCGTAFRVTPAGVITNLYNFCSVADCLDGSTLFDGLAVGRDGKLYGTTWNGGMANAGTVFSIRTDGHVTTIYSFCSQTGCADGQNPLWLALGKDGYFYGTTFSGAGTGFGSVFRITPAGVFTTLYNFCSQPACADGAQPRAGLALAVNTGDFYGTTYLGGAHNLGTVFRITPSGPFSLLHSFSGEDGEYPIGGISYRPNGMLYGTTTHGGSSADGTVFKITLPHKAQ